MKRAIDLRKQIEFLEKQTRKKITKKIDQSDLQHYVLKYASDSLLREIIEDKLRYIDDDIFNRYYQDALTMLRSGYIENNGPKISASVLLLYFNNGCHNTGNKYLENHEDVWIFTNGPMYFMEHFRNQAKEEGKTYGDIFVRTKQAYMNYLDDYFFRTSGEKELILKKRYD